ncbi:hypothetical protein NRK68_02310 [Streptomyces yangpuensis]|uniref:Uncharacterized protein n=1 Tax=Streptomyces yangpuensis TaxID=1648182 RepID=A0ABY5PPU6_9ACTN|nr:hypothetical protein [Streptomyces yangpuensis]MBZ9594015.1 hypothetical protein [Streptomyces erythrochromogenes]UUY46147.1 hypothetical protein NRK68_02310 [Streptomyces yangpuensis]
MGRRIWDKWTGTEYPAGGVRPLPTTELREALLALNHRNVPFNVRHGRPEEKADLVADCEIPQVRLTLKTRMRLVPAKREVLVLEERWEPSPDSGRQYGRGGFKVYRQWEFRRGADGRRHKVETLRFDTRDVRDPLRTTVLRAGWTWRGVLFRY